MSENQDCVCGFNPPDEPNLDCERCQLITKLARLREAAKPVVEYYDNRGIGIGALSERIERLKQTISEGEDE